MIKFSVLPSTATFRAIFNGTRVRGRSMSYTSELADLYGARDDEQLNQLRKSHHEFFLNRSWGLVAKFWYDSINNPSTSSPLLDGDSEYGANDMQMFNSADRKAGFVSDERRKRFALRVGYAGSLYKGYQSQNGVEHQVTVENDLRIALGCVAYGAVRTAATVSAISQIITIPGAREDTCETLIQKLKVSEPVLSGRLAVYDCVRVPNTCNVRSSAIWQRNLFLLPLNKGVLDGYDIDVEFVNEALKRIENVELPYDAFAFGPETAKGERQKELSTLYRARASTIENFAKSSSDSHPELFVEDSYEEIFVSEYDVRPYRPTKGAMCVELVGSKFLRKMACILVATAARESSLAPKIRNVNILMDICNTGKRSLAAYPLPSIGQCLAGVGFQPLDQGSVAFIESNNALHSKKSWLIGYSCKPTVK